MSDLIRQESRELIELRAGKTAIEIHAADKAEQIAKLIKNADALLGAVTRKLEAQRDFAAIHDELFHPGRPWPSNSDTSVGIKSPDWCLGHGFHERNVERWHGLLDPDKYSADLRAKQQKCWATIEGWQPANFSSEHNNWYTPAKYIDAVRKALGEIDLDPASSWKANQTVRATKIFTVEDNGLLLPWFGRVFLNPPYGDYEDENGKKYRSQAAVWCRKAIDEFKSGHIEGCIILVNSLHSQSWQRPLYDFTICLVDHRIHFVSADGQENESPTFQNIFVYLGHEPDRFAQAFHGTIGCVMWPTPQIRRRAP
jgi:ParB family chromosome partitioning protein